MQRFEIFRFQYVLLVFYLETIAQYNMLSMHGHDILTIVSLRDSVLNPSSFSQISNNGPVLTGLSTRTESTASQIFGGLTIMLGDCHLRKSKEIKEDSI